MALVSYSDSEGSDDEKPQTYPEQNSSALAATQPQTSFALDKSNPRKIQVKLQETKVDAPSNFGAPDGEPAPKRQRLGGGAFGGFNSILPAPKRDNETPNPAATGQPRKIFSLKTGAERAFDREADADLKQLFAEQHADVTAPNTSGTENRHTISVSPSSVGSTSASTAPKTGTPMMFKPLSVARKPQKKKPPTTIPNETSRETKSTAYPAVEEVSRPTPKVSLFSTGGDIPTHGQSAASTTEYQPLIYEARQENAANPGLDFIGEVAHGGGLVDEAGHDEVHHPAGPQSLDAIASDLNLSASARRQLFGRNSGAGNNAVNVINFNTDKEYAANEVLRASGEQIQHNPVRAPASGKHSLKQLVSLATGQKDALEESFAAGRQNKKEAGSKYGW
jgi:hypothetical protein